MATRSQSIVVPTIESLVSLRHGARHLSFFPKKQALAVMSGNYRSHFRGRGMDFDEVRPYQPGDDIRTIDWRVTARTDRPHTKVFREERERPVLIAVDLRSSMFFGSVRLKSVIASEIAATLAWAALNANDRVGGMIFGPRRQRDNRSRRSHHNVLEFINNLSASCEDLLTPQQDQMILSQIVEDVRRGVVPGTSVVIISDFLALDRECEKHLFALAKHCDLTLAWVTDPLEIELPPPGNYTVADGGKRFLLNTRDTSLREAFQSNQVRWQQQIESLATQLGLGLLRFSTRDPVMPELIRHYGTPRSQQAS